MLTYRVFRDPVSVYLQNLNIYLFIYYFNYQKFVDPPLTGHPHKIEPILFTCSEILHLVIIMEKIKRVGDTELSHFYDPFVG